MKSFLVRCLSLSLLLFTVSWGAMAESFRVEDIRINGLLRVPAKTVFSELPIKVDDQISQLTIQDAVRELFKTGFFAEIDIARDENILIITVKERPAVNRIGVTGNSVLATEPLLAGLKNIGLVEGDIFKRSAIDQIERELNAQYSSVGRYATDIRIKVIELQNNQVNIGIKIVEGEVAEIKHVNVVGNQQFSDEELQGLLEVQETGRWSWISGNDKYEKQKLAGDLDRLKSFYFDRGFLEFEAVSTQVSLSPDKKSVYITLNIVEGSPYTISEVDLIGDLILPESEINAFLTVEQGDVFSQKELLSSSAAISQRLGEDGYSFANVRGVPDLNKEKKTAKVSFFIDPGNIYYVRRIVFSGNTSTQDNVLRREMRQLEGAPVSSEKLEQSKVRLQRLPIFSSVDLRTEQVPGRTDQLDAIFTVVEQPSGNVNASLGFSQGSGITLGAGIQQTNWLGTGNTLGFQVDKSDVETNYSLNYNNPYFTQDGVSRGIRVFFQERDLDELDVSSFSTDRLGIDVTFGYPISENSRVSFGVGVEKLDVQAGFEASQEIAQSPRARTTVENLSINTSDVDSRFVDSNGNGFRDEDDSTSNVTIPTSAVTTPVSQADLLPDNPQGFLDRFGTSFNNVNLNLGWSTTTLNRGIFPTNGQSQRLRFETTVPGGDLEFYKLTYKSEFYRALSSKYTLRLKGRLGYADSYGSFDTLPFFENFFAGGSNSVRGFEQSSLGPKGTPATSFQSAPFRNANGDIDFAYIEDGGNLVTFTESDADARTLGGNILFEAGAEIIFPVPFAEGAKSVRSVFFVDAGNVFSTQCTSTQPVCSDFDLSKLSAAAGIGIQWLSPVGPLAIYISKAIQEQEFDETESFQFSLGQSF